LNSSGETPAILSALRGVNESTRSIVKKKRRKSQTSQDKAVATNYHSRQTSGKNQNREYFTVFFPGIIWFNSSCLENFKDGLRGFSGASN
jgi:hypothetical protein